MFHVETTIKGNEMKTIAPGKFKSKLLNEAEPALIELAEDIMATAAKRTVVKISIPTRNQLKLQAVKNNMTMMDYIQYLLDLHKKDV